MPPFLKSMPPFRKSMTPFEKTLVLLWKKPHFSEGGHTFLEGGQN